LRACAFDFERVRGLIYDFNLKHRKSQSRDVAARDAAVLDVPPSATEAAALLLGMQDDVQPFRARIATSTASARCSPALHHRRSGRLGLWPAAAPRPVY